MVRAALIHLLIGSAIGGWLLAAKGGAVEAAGWLLPAHGPILLIGWLVQVTIGVGYWILPKYARGPERGPPWAPWATAVLLNLGTALTAGSRGLPPASALGIAIAALGVVGFVATAAPRIKPFGAGR
jgi:hypothetical protein